MASRDMPMCTIRGTSNSGNTAAARLKSSRTGTPESLSRSGSMPPTVVSPAARMPASVEKPSGWTAMPP